MAWFNGPISGAISKAKENKAPLAVFVTSKDPSDGASVSLESYWCDPEVESACMDANVVALKLAEGTQAANQFAQIYPVIRCPVLFLIGVNGAPLEAIIGTTELGQDAFLAKVTSALQLHRKQQEAEAGCSSQQESRSTPNDSGEVGTASAAPTSSARPLNNRVERAKELLEKNKQEKARKELEEMKERERRRIEDGKGVLETKRRLEEREINAAAEERRRKKKDDQEALQRIKLQIAADRADKQARFDQTTDENVTKMEEEKKKNEAARLEKEAKEQAEKRLVSRHDLSVTMQEFSAVLPMDRRCLPGRFDADQPLRDVYNFVVESSREPAGFTLIQMYPRREFTSEEQTMTLRELNLAPSAVLVVMPKSGRLARSDGGGNGGVGHPQKMGQAAGNIVNAVLAKVLGSVKRPIVVAGEGWLDNVMAKADTLEQYLDAQPTMLACFLRLACDHLPLQDMKTQGQAIAAAKKAIVVVNNAMKQYSYVDAPPSRKRKPKEDVKKVNKKAKNSATE